MDIITPPGTPRYTPPRKDDVLFCDDVSDWWNNAYVNWGGEDIIEYGYRQGYRRGAALLAQYVNENRGETDALVYPIIFLYRHYVELALKHLISVAQDLAQNYMLPKATKDVPTGHNLNILWKKCKPLVNAVFEAAGWEKLDTAEEEGIDNYIVQLVEFDPNSTSWRYTHSKDGAPSLPKKLEHINIRHFAERMERLASCLDDIWSGLGGLAYECDMASDGDYA